MERYSASEYRLYIARFAPMIFLLLVGLGYFVANPSDPLELSDYSHHPKPVYRDDGKGINNYTASGDDYAIDDDSAGDFDTRLSFALFITLFAGIITFYRSGFYYGVLKGSVNSFLYDSTFGYSPLRSPPSA